MTDTITIPAEALEAAVKAYSDAPIFTPHADAIRAACLAMLANWPGMDANFFVLRTGQDVIILPFTENTDER